MPTSRFRPMPTKWYILLLCLITLVPLRAQDIHFSHVDSDPMLLNPAYAGFFNGKGRFGMMYRNQWASVSIPYQTIALTGEMALLRIDGNRYGLSLGASVFNDNAGTLSYGTTSAHLALSGFASVGRHGNNHLSIGLEGGYAVAGFDPTNADMEDPSEYFDMQQTSYPLLCVGAAWYSQPSGELQTKLGFAIRNLNRPDISWSHLDNTRLERRYSLFARAEYRHWQLLSIIPQVNFQAQGKYRELVYGADVKWYLSEGGQHEISMRTGLALRQTDALIANIIFEYDAMVFIFCYDANTSGLIAASGSFGAVEVGLVYRIADSKKKTRAIKCPVY